MTLTISTKEVWDAITALGTLSMAIATFFVVLQGRRLRKDDDQHHQDEFRPICVFSPFDGMDPRHSRDELLTILNSPRPGFGKIEIKCMRELKLVCSLCHHKNLEYFVVMSDEHLRRFVVGDDLEKFGEIQR